jgi:hypothetical protein
MMDSLRMRWSPAVPLILFAGLLTARAGDLSADSQSGAVSAVSTEAAPSDGEAGQDAGAPAPAQGGGSQSGSGFTHRVGIGVDVSILLGTGVQGAVSLTPKLNVRGGFNFFTYSTTQNFSGFSVDGTLHLRSAEALLDFYPFHGFHLSPGALIYNGNKVTANLTTASGTTFTLNGTTYTSGAGNPVTGAATVSLNDYKVAPMFLFGFGNLVPRSGRHFGFVFDIGAAAIGSPKFALNLAGTACSAGGGCVNAATNPAVQSNLQTTVQKANNSISFLQALPVIRLVFGYSF